MKAQLNLGATTVTKASMAGVVSAWNSEPKSNASSDLTHGSSEVLAGNVARGLRRRRARKIVHADPPLASSAAEIARALLEEKKKAWERQNIGSTVSSVGKTRPTLVIEGLEKLVKSGGGSDPSGHSTRQSSARTSTDGDSCKASSASFVTPRDALNSRGSVKDELSLISRRLVKCIFPYASYDLLLASTI